MNTAPTPDWDPRSEEVQRDQLVAYDRMREECPVAYSDFLGWSIFRHEDVLRVLNDPVTFSSVVSARRVVPSGMDPPEHTEYRRIIDCYFQPELMQAFEPQCRQIATDLVTSLLVPKEVDFIADFAQPFAVRAQCAFLGWPSDMHARLQDWLLKNHDATFAQDRAALAELAHQFEGYVLDLLQSRRAAGTHPDTDLTCRLMQEQVSGRPMTDEEIVSILRNWTAGEVGTIAASIGILGHFLAEHPEWQQTLRSNRSLLPDAIDEILRLHGPLVANRRVTTRSVEIGGRTIGAGEQISLNWIAANRDSRVFPDPDTFRLHRKPSDNLLYGSGIHVCPGAPLARLELRLVVEELLSRSAMIEFAPGKPSIRSRYPASGFSALFLQIR